MYWRRQKTVLVFYHAVTESVIRDDMFVWFDNLTVKTKSELVVDWH